MSKKSIVHGHVLGEMSVDKLDKDRSTKLALAIAILWKINIIKTKVRDKSLDPKSRTSHIQKIEKLEQFEPNFLHKILLYR